MDKTLELLFLAFGLFVATLAIDVVVAPTIPWGMFTSIYWLALYGCWLGFFPTYVATKSSLRDGATLLGFSLLLWSIEDPLYYISRGYPAFSPFPEHPGMYPLMVYWWPVWFLLLSRLFAGFVILVYICMDPGWGQKAVRVALASEEVKWILKVVAVICAGVLIFSVCYSYYTRAGFGGEIIYRTDPSYNREQSPETLYRGVLLRKTVEIIALNPEIRYVLARHGNLSELILAKPYWMAGSDESDVLDSYLGREVEILGKMVWKQYRGELFAGRIREAKERGLGDAA